MGAQERAIQLAIKGAVSELPLAQRQRIEKLATKLKTIIEKAGEDGSIAFTLVAAEIAANAED